MVQRKMPEAVAGNLRAGMEIAVEGLLAADAAANPFQVRKLAPTLPAVDNKEQE